MKEADDKIEQLQIHTWEEADKALSRIGMIQNRIQEIELEINSEQKRLQDNLQFRIQPLKFQKEICEKYLEEFTRENISEVAPAKSKELICGLVGIRTYQKYGWGNNIAKLLAKIQALGKYQWIRTKEEPDKETIKKEATLAEMRTIGVKVTTHDDFYYEVKPPKSEAA